MFSVPVDVKGLEEKQRIDIDEMDLDRFMDVHVLNQVPSEEPVIVTYFELDGDVRNMAVVLNTYKDSYIFKMCWVKEAEEFAQATHDDEDDEYDEEELAENKLPLTTKDIQSDIFQECYNKYQDIYAELKDGSMTFEDVDVKFKAYIGKYEELAADVKIMCRLDPSDNQRWIQNRIQQIEQYHELHLAVESAQVVMRVKQALCLQGDFQVLEKLLVAVSHLFCYLLPSERYILIQLMW